MTESTAPARAARAAADTQLPSPADHSRRRLLHGGLLLAGAALLPRGVHAGAGVLAMRDYLASDATGLAMLARHGDVSGEELLALALVRCDAIDPQLNAIAHRHDELGRKAASWVNPARPFVGVPFLLADLRTYLAGTVTSEGSCFFASGAAPFTSTLVQRQLDAGLCVFGKTTVSELGGAGTGATPRGPTRNPWHLDYGCGPGASGAAAAVAAGIVPLAHAVDTAAGFGLAAAACGLVALKPTRGRIPFGPVHDAGRERLMTAHAVARSVRDSAALLDATQGSDARPAATPGGFLSGLRNPAPRLRIALVTAAPGGGAMAPGARDAAEHAAGLCRALGHEVIPRTLPPLLAEIGAVVATLADVGLATMVQERAAELGREPRHDELGAAAHAACRRARSLQALAHEQAQRTLDMCGFALAAFMQDVDVLLTPTTPLPPLRIDTAVDTNAQRAFTALYAAAGQPAITLPLHQDASGMPVGVLFGARAGDDALLLQLAAQLEASAPWSGRASPLLRAALA